jgi:hypothetical protein
MRMSHDDDPTLGSLCGVPRSPALSSGGAHAVGVAKVMPLLAIAVRREPGLSGREAALNSRQRSCRDADSCRLFSTLGSMPRCHPVSADRPSSMEPLDLSRDFQLGTARIPGGNATCSATPPVRQPLPHEPFRADEVGGPSLGSGAGLIVIRRQAERRADGQSPRNSAAVADEPRPMTLKDSTMRVYRYRLWDWPRILAVGLPLVMAGVALKAAGAPQWDGALAGRGAFAIVLAFGRRPVHKE